MTVLEHWFEEVWNKGRVEAIDELWVPEKQVHGLKNPSGDEVKSIHEFKSFHQLFRTAFPDMRVTVEETVTEGDKTMARVIVTGTHTGPGLHKPPTAKPVRFAGMCMARLKDGHVVESWNTFDFIGMNRQLE